MSSRDFKQLIDGEMLGDGCLYIQPNDANARYVFGSASKEYRDWLITQFNKHGINETSVCDRQRNGSNVYEFKTWVDTRLTEARKRWYPDGSKRVPDDIVLKPKTLLHWYIGDGSLRKHSGVRFATQGFTDEGLQLLINNLDSLDFKCTVHSDRSIYLRPQSSMKFFDYMLDCPDQLLDVYGYKWPDASH